MYLQNVNPVTDILDQFDFASPREAKLDDNRIAVLARSAMTAADNLTPQGRLWTGNYQPDNSLLLHEDKLTSFAGEPVNCTVNITGEHYSLVPASCSYGSGNTLGSMYELPDPYLAQLPAGYNTGLIRQYLPRINSTARRELVAEADYPTSCSNLTGAFYVRYGSVDLEYRDLIDDRGNWSLEACMPADLSKSPWRGTRDRQDFTEELYLNISLDSAGGLGQFNTAEEKGGLFKISLDTTAGYFELPSYHNGQQPGPLLDKDPMMTDCGGNCKKQTLDLLFNRTDSSNLAKSRVRRDDGDFSETSKSSLELELLKNRGPLATVALALFGSGSFIAERFANPDGFIYPEITKQTAAEGHSYVCVDQAPLIGLLRKDNFWYTNSELDPCVTNGVVTHDDLQVQLMEFAHTLYYHEADGYSLDDSSHITNAFTAAAFLTNEAWLTYSSVDPSWYVYYDLGADAIVPVISMTGIVIVSLLLGLFLTALFAIAIYCAITPRWADQLDAFAILRLGASLAGDIKLRLARNKENLKLLDELPGWVGDATDGKGAVGELALGAQSSLEGGRKYTAYG